MPHYSPILWTMILILTSLSLLAIIVNIYFLKVNNPMSTNTIDKSTPDWYWSW